HEFDGADVEALRRLGNHEHVRLVFDLARQNDLLLVAAGKVARVLVDTAHAHVIALRKGLRMPVDGGEIDPATSRKWRRAIAAQHHVESDAAIEVEAHALPVFRHESEPQPALALLWIVTFDVDVIDLDPSGCNFTDAADRLGKFALAVS